ncbi:MAG: VPLPA-CTERM sorting domain-containing protein [Pseudorhodobacter sp.]|nr:VPLPA-CTERM sorting domain-containing protein [Pseudorhodobacter sp.]
MKHVVKSALLSAALVMAGAAASFAATVDFTGAGEQGGGSYTEDGLVFDDIRIVNGNCDSASGRPCGALNDNETSTLTQVGGGTFTLSSFWYQLLGNGNPNTLTVMSDLGGLLTFASDVVGHNDDGHTVDLTGLALFQNISSLTFSTTDGGNVRIDDLVLAGTGPSEVPLPAGGLLLLGGLGALAAFRRRKQA